jgi:hypothetical protein
MGTPGAGTMRGMGGSMPRHRQLMMGGVPEPYASMANPLPGTAPVIARGRAVFRAELRVLPWRGGMGER